MGKLGRQLRALRRARDLTQDALAARAGLTPRTVRKLENGGTGYVASMRTALAALGHELAGEITAKRIGMQPLTIRPIRAAGGTWSTPPHIIEAVLVAFGAETFCLDPASPDPATVPCRRLYTEHDDGLAQEWTGDLVWVNPPYDAVPRWLGKIIEEYEAGRARRVVGLLPYLPHVHAWKVLLRSGADVRVLHDRLKFGNRRYISPSCSALCVWGGTAADLAALSRTLPAHHRVVAP